MRKLKQISALLLVFVILLFSGCANIEAILGSFGGNDSDFYEVTALSQKATQYASIDILNDNILFLTSSDIEAYELTLYDVQKDRIIAEASLADCPLEYIYGAKFISENEIVVFDEYNQKAISYDFNLNKIGEVDYEPEYDYDTAPRTDLMNDRFSYMDSYAYAYENDRIYLIFYDMIEDVYVYGNYDKNILDEYDQKLLVDEFLYTDEFDVKSITLSIEDFKNKVTVNELLIDNPENGYYIDIPTTALSDKYACFVKCIINDRTGAEKYIPYIWKYTKNQINRPIEIGKMTEGDFNQENARFISEIKNKYGISIKVNEPAELSFYDEEYNASPFEVYIVLSQLSECLDLFPDNFVKEIYDREYVDEFNIHIVQNIWGANAYANGFTSVYEIVFCSSGFSKGIVFHELMHLIDNTIYDYYYDHDMDFYDMWTALNPDGFEYYSEEDYEIDEDYFASYYAMTNIDEDMAETFQYMYEAYQYDDEHRFGDYEHVNEKAALLCKAIRNAFPSMANVDEVCWEKYVNLEN